MSTTPARREAARLVLAALAAAALSACASTNRDFYAHRFQTFEPSSVALPNPPFPPRALVMYGGTTDVLLSWVDLLEGVRWADVIVLGEIHDDAVGHLVQLAVVEDAMNAWPGTTLSMEMLERDEQALVDRYLAGEIDRAAFMAAAREGSWMRNPDWAAWYQPMIDAAKAHDRPVVAANAPRRLVRMARLEGYDALRALPAEEQALFDLPRGTLPDGGYAARFRALMESGAQGHGSIEDERVESVFRSQRLWDATMAQSVADALDAGADRVVHLVGQFHSDFNGGLVQEIQGRAPFARILVVSMQPVDSSVLRAEDVDRADVVVYTGVDDGT